MTKTEFEERRMTNKEAKSWLKLLLRDKYAFNSGDRDAFMAAIKALEHEECEKVVPMSVIEDIKAEIEQRKKDTLSYKDNNAETGCEFWDFALGLQEAMAIIDKHISGKGNK